MSATYHSTFSPRTTMLLRTFLVLFAINIRVGFGFYCVSSGEWIPIDWVCDAQSDCSDSSDESYDLNCVYQKIFLKKGRESAAMYNPWRGIHRRSDSEFAEGVDAYPTSWHFLGDHGQGSKRAPLEPAPAPASTPDHPGAAPSGAYDLFRHTPQKLSTMTAPLYAKYLPDHQVPAQGLQQGSDVIGHVTNGAARRSDSSNDVTGFYGNHARWVTKRSPKGHDGFKLNDLVSEHH